MSHLLPPPRRPRQVVRAPLLRPVPHWRSTRSGCVVVRRLMDARGREWRVREVWSAAGHALLFQCEVRGLRSEVRAVRAPLESLTNDELVTELERAED